MRGQLRRAKARDGSELLLGRGLVLGQRLVSALLQHCDSVKAKRLFLALADRHRHAWLAHVTLQNVDLGSGKRVLVPGGKLNAKYQITLPADLDEQLG